MHETSKYSLYNLVEIPYADPVCAIAINHNLLAIGTMLELSAENISGINFESESMINISVGDREYFKYEFSENQSGQLVINSHTKEDIQSGEDHFKKCDTAFVLMGKEKLLLIDLNNEDHHEIKKNLKLAKTIHLMNNSRINYEFEVSCYSVPFDYDDTKYLWLEFLDESTRQISIFYFDTLKTFEYILPIDFGHISHMKLLPDNKLLLIRKHHLCEVREIEKNFKLIHSFNNIGLVEVLAVDCKTVRRIAKDTKNDITNTSEDNLIITLLDIKGNVNVWCDSEITNQFNLYEMNDIKDEFKKKRFFSMNYPYYIRTHENYFALSTDFGVFIIKRK